MSQYTHAPEIDSYENKIQTFGISPIFEWERKYALEQIRKDSNNTIHFEYDFFISAMEQSGKILWRTCYFSLVLDDSSEKNIQEFFPVDFSLQGNTLIVTLRHFEENDRIFHIMKDDGDIKMKSPY